MAKETQNKTMAIEVKAAMVRNLPEGFSEENICNKYAQLKQLGRSVEWTLWAVDDNGEKYLLHVNENVAESNLEGTFHVGKIKETDLPKGIHSIKD